MMAFDIPEGFNTTKTKGNTEINFLPGTNLKIIKGKKAEDLLENKSPGSNPEASTGPTLKLTKNHTLAKLEPSDEDIQKAKEDLAQPQMQLQPAEILPNQAVPLEEMAIAPAVAQGISLDQQASIDLPMNNCAYIPQALAGQNALLSHQTIRVSSS